MAPKKRGAKGKRLCEDGLNCKYIHEYQHSLEFSHEDMPDAPYDWSKGGGHKLGGSSTGKTRTTGNSNSSSSAPFSGTGYKLGSSSCDSRSSSTHNAGGTRITTLGSPTAGIYHSTTLLSRGITVGKNNIHNSILSIGRNPSPVSAQGHSLSHSSVPSLGEKQTCTQCGHMVYIKFWDEHCRIMHPHGKVLGSSFVPSSSLSTLGSHMHYGNDTINSTTTDIVDNDDKVQCGICFKSVELWELATHMEMHENAMCTNPLSRSDNTIASSSSSSSSTSSIGNNSNCSNLPTSSHPGAFSSGIHMPTKRSRGKNRNGLRSILMPSSSSDDDDDDDVQKAKKDSENDDAGSNPIDLISSIPTTSDTLESSSAEIIDLT